MRSYHKPLNSNPKEKAFETKMYQLETVLHLLQAHSSVVLPPLDWQLSPSGSSQTIVDLFIAYLIFDCLIGNQDRHDQNWGYIISIDNEGKGKEIRFAPTFDHASSLACRLSEAEKKDRLKTRDYGYSIQHFASKARTPFFFTQKRLSTFDCLKIALEHQYASKDIGNEWIDKLSLVNKDSLTQLFEQFPEGYISPVSVDFTRTLILNNKQRIQQLRA